MDSNQKVAILFQQGHTTELINKYARSRLSIPASYLLGISFLFEKKYKKAINTLAKIKKHASNLPDYYSYAALIFLKLNDLKKADISLSKEKNKGVLYYEVAIECALKQNKLRRTFNLINASKKAGIDSFDIKLNTATAYRKKNKFKKALHIFERLYSEHPLNKVVLENLIEILTIKRDNESCETLILKYLNNYPENFSYLWLLTTIYSARGDYKQMIKYLNKSLEYEGEKQSYIRASIVFPSVFQSSRQLVIYRKKIETILNKAIAAGHFPKRPDKIYCTTPFFLTYHSQINKPILSKMARVYRKGLLKVPALNATIIKKKRPRIAIVSQHFFNHSIMDFYANTLVNLPEEFDVTFVFVLPNKVDDVTKALSKRANAFIKTTDKHDELLPYIFEERFDAIIYPEIGISSCIYFLAMQRLAPLQMVLIGHPETSGCRTIDYYISWKNFHSKGAPNQFVEKLVQLNNIPICYNYPKAIDSSKKSWESLGVSIPKHAKVFSIPVTLFKFQPEYDRVIKGILCHPSHVIVMVCYDKIERYIKQRFSRSLTDSQMNQIKFIETLQLNDYFALLKNSHVILEPFPFGGGNTVLQSMAAGTPVISLQSNQLKGSFGTGFYKWIGHTSYIASTVEEYIRLAINTAYNSTAKRDFYTLIQMNKKKLFGNMSGSYEFYDWLKEKLLVR
jgi:protein O-GlcNAc transferase